MLTFCGVFFNIRERSKKMSIKWANFWDGNIRSFLSGSWKFSASSSAGIKSWSKQNGFSMNEQNRKAKKIYWKNLTIEGITEWLNVLSSWWIIASDLYIKLTGKRSAKAHEVVSAWFAERSLKASFRKLRKLCGSSQSNFRVRVIKERGKRLAARKDCSFKLEKWS